MKKKEREKKLREMLMASLAKKAHSYLAIHTEMERQEQARNIERIERIKRENPDSLGTDTNGNLLAIQKINCDKLFKPDIYSGIQAEVKDQKE